MDKLVSIIVSFYNEELFLGEAIKSVLDSSYSNFELILVDDGSTDNSENIVKSFSDDRIVYIKQEKNQGQGNGRNVGLSISKGDYIGFFDGDDRIDRLKIEKQVDFLEKHDDIILVSGGFSLMDYDGKVYKENCMPNKYENLEIRSQMLFSNVIACGGGALFRRSLIDEYKVLFDVAIRSSQDYKFFIDCLECGKVANMEEVLFYYRIGDPRYSSQTTKIREKNKEQYDRDMIGIFHHAWKKRGFDISNQDAKFIYEHFYGKKRIGIKDRFYSASLKRRIKTQAKKKNMPEASLIISTYKKIEKEKLSDISLNVIIKKLKK